MPVFTRKTVDINRDTGNRALLLGWTADHPLRQLDV
jgi:hypothetical protein